MSRLLEKMKRDQEAMMYGDDKLGHRVTGEKSPFAKIVEPPHSAGDHVKIERNADGRIVGVVAFLAREGKSRTFHIDEIRALRFISDPSLIEDSPEDFLRAYGHGLIDMARFRHKKEQSAKVKAKVEASESWLTDDQREVLRSLGE